MSMVRTIITCDSCGKEILGDCEEVRIWRQTFYVCNIRTAPVNKCGNETVRKLLQNFKHSDVATILLESLNRID